jgi:hypothetical protein
VGSILPPLLPSAPQLPPLLLLLLLPPSLEPESGILLALAFETVVLWWGTADAVAVVKAKAAQSIRAP